jgi:hypothetical protein
MENRLEPLEDLVGDLFVDRQRELDLLWDWATSIPHRIGNSFALIGRRRTGKTAILVKLFNRLFYEQEDVLPVFISFARHLHLKKPITSYDFAREYLTGYASSYLAFRYRQPRLLYSRPTLEDLRDFAHQIGDDYALALFKRYERYLVEPTPYGLVQWVINFPMGEARERNMPTAMIVDEFQVLTDVYDPRQNVHHDLTDSFQWAVDTKWAPVLVSGSAVSLLVGQALGGMLSDRFNYWYLDPLTREYAHDLVFRLSDFARVTVNEELAEALWQLTAGYPYSIFCLMTSFCLARQRYPSPDALEQVLTFELTNPRGKLWQHYREEFGKYSQQLNEGPATRRVMLWATRYPGERIDAERVAREIGVDVAEVSAALEKLRWVDVVEKIGLISYRGPTDPMMRRFIEYQHYTEIEQLTPTEAAKDWHEEYKRLRGRMNNFVGEVAEVYVQAVMHGFDGRQVDGDRYLNYAGLVQLPIFEKVERRGGIVKGGVPIEIDLVGEWTLPLPSIPPARGEAKGGRGAWLVQVKYKQAPAGEDDVRHFLAQTEAVVAEKGCAEVTRWYFCKRGYTAEAARALQQAGVLFSNREQFNDLAKLCGFFGLPR